MFNVFNRKGDYCRYKAEFSFGSVKAEASEKSLQAYKEAQKFAENLGTTHPVRLGLSLNFSVFYYEICDNSEEACKIAKKVGVKYLTVMNYPLLNLFRHSMMPLQIWTKYKKRNTKTVLL